MSIWQNTYLKVLPPGGQGEQLPGTFRLAANRQGSAGCLRRLALPWRFAANRKRMPVSLKPVLADSITDLRHEP